MFENPAELIAAMKKRANAEKALIENLVHRSERAGRMEERELSMRWAALFFLVLSAAASFIHPSAQVSMLFCSAWCWFVNVHRQRTDLPVPPIEAPECDCPECQAEREGA